MNKPKVSVIMALYNTEKYLKESVMSVLKQSMRDFELIIVDDCSTDNSMKIAKKLASKDKRIKIIRNKVNQGALCRNRGIEVAKGEYIAIHDSDDICMKDRLKIQTKYLDTHPDIFLVAGSFWYIDESGNYLGKEIIDYNHEKITSKIVAHNMIHNPTVMFRNDVQTFYREKMKISEDRDLWLLLLTRGKKMTVLPNILIKYRMHPSSITSSKARKQSIFSEKAIEWYYERKKFGRDSYNNFDPDTILSMKDKKDHGEHYLIKKKIGLLLLEDKKKYRKELLAYWKKYGLRQFKRLPISYFLSFAPKAFFESITKFNKWFKYYLMKRKAP